MEAWRLKIEAWRLKMEAWRACRQVVADLHHPDEKSRLRIRGEVKNVIRIRIRIHIKEMRIRNLWFPQEPCQSVEFLNRILQCPSGGFNTAQLGTGNPSQNLQTFKKPRNQFQGIDSSSLSSLVGRYDKRVIVPARQNGGIDSWAP